MTTTTTTTTTKSTTVWRGVSRVGLGAVMGLLPLFFIGCAAMGWASAANGVPLPVFDTSGLESSVAHVVGADEEEGR